MDFEDEVEVEKFTALAAKYSKGELVADPSTMVHPTFFVDGSLESVSKEALAASSLSNA